MAFAKFGKFDIWHIRRIKIALGERAKILLRNQLYMSLYDEKKRNTCHVTLEICGKEVCTITYASLSYVKKCLAPLPYDLLWHKLVKQKNWRPDTGVRLYSIEEVKEVEK